MVDPVERARAIAAQRKRDRTFGGRLVERATDFEDFVFRPCPLHETLSALARGDGAAATAFLKSARQLPQPTAFAPPEDPDDDLDDGEGWGTVDDVIGDLIDAAQTAIARGDLIAADSIVWSIIRPRTRDGEFESWIAAKTERSNTQC